MYNTYTIICAYRYRLALVYLQYVLQTTGGEWMVHALTVKVRSTSDWFSKDL